MSLLLLLAGLAGLAITGIALIYGKSLPWLAILVAGGHLWLAYLTLHVSYQVLMAGSGAFANAGNPGGVGGFMLGAAAIGAISLVVVAVLIARSFGTPAKPFLPLILLPALVLIWHQHGQVRQPNERKAQRRPPPQAASPVAIPGYAQLLLQHEGSEWARLNYIYNADDCAQHARESSLTGAFVTGCQQFLLWRQPRDLAADGARWVAEHADETEEACHGRISGAPPEFERACVRTVLDLRRRREALRQSQAGVAEK